MRRLLVFIALLGAGCVDADAPIHPGDNSTFLFIVPKGATAYGIRPALEKQGMAPSEFAWKRFIKGSDSQGACIKAGRHELRKSMSLNQVLQALCAAPLADDIPLTIVEGWRIKDIDAALTEKGLIQQGQYAELATQKKVDLPFAITSPTLEGYLWPETYKISPARFTAKTFIERQLQTFQTRFLSKYSGDLGQRTLHDVVVMASMLEREEPTPANRTLVSGILWKRLDNGWQLGVDATSRYELTNWNDKKAFLKRLRDASDKYNTRTNKGLPPTAIGNPSLSSLQAALTPKASPYWYYLHDSKKKLHPAKDAVGHEANRKRYNVY